MAVLTECSDGVRKTSLASKTGLNYYACSRYVELLEFLRWIIGPAGKGGVIVLTDMGREFSTLLADEKSPNIDGINPDSLALTYDNESDGAKSSKQSTSEPWMPIDFHSDTEEQVKNVNIMIIDDEPDVLLTFRLNLAECGFDSFVTTDPSAALEEFRQNVRKYDLVISDVRMKSLNGFQLYKQLKALKPDVKIILVSALDIPSEIFSILPGFRKEDFVSKPVDPDVLVKKVQTIMGDSRMGTRESDKA